MLVQIWSDIVCPWCYIGKRRFETALAAWPDRDAVEVSFHSFELDPHAPAGTDISVPEHLADKYGVTLERAREMIAHAEREAVGEGLEYRLLEAKRSNTFDAHRLTHLAREHGLQRELVERLMRAYFTETEAIGDPATLLRLAREIGMDAERVGRVLAGNDYAEAVRNDQREAARLRITGVPFFVYDRKYAVSGAQPAALHLQVMERVEEESGTGMVNARTA